MRFSLRTAFIATTLLCIALGFHLQATRRQKQAVDAIRAVDGWVAYDYAWKDGGWIQGSKSWVPVWLTSALGEDAFHRVVAVNLSALFHSAHDEHGHYYGPDPEAVVPGELWQAVESLRSTEWLCLNARNLADEELRHLRGLPRLMELKMEAVPIDGSGLQHLATLPSLRDLNLSRVHLKDEHGHWLVRLKQLRVLGLQESTISQPVAADLQQNMPWCQHHYEPWPPDPAPANPWIGIQVDDP